MREPSESRSRRWRVAAIVVGVTLVSTVLLVGASRGFPSTHWMVHGFLHDTLGLSYEASDQVAAVIRKSFHVPAYALVAFLVWAALPARWRRPWVVLVVVLAVACTDEWLQSRQPNRSASIRDVGVDLVGAGLGILLGRRVLPAAARREDRASG